MTRSSIDPSISLQGQMHVASCKVSSILCCKGSTAHTSGRIVKTSPAVVADSFEAVSLLDQLFHDLAAASLGCAVDQLGAKAVRHPSVTCRHLHIFSALQ